MKRYLGLAACLMITLAIGVKFRPAAVYAQVGGNTYDPSGNAPLAGDNTITFTRVGSGYSAHAPGGGGGGTPGGTNGAIQYNNSGAFGGAVITGLVKGNGTSAPAAAVSATDYAPATTGSSILKASSGGFANAVSGTDYAPATSGTSILKGNNTGGFANAVSGTDYQPVIAGNTLASHNFANSINAAGTVAGAQPAFTDISGVATGAQLPNPSASTLGGVESLASVSHNFLTSISTSGVPAAAQPSAADIAAGTFAGADTFSSPPTMSGANISATTIPTGSLATVQGNGTKVQLSTGTTTTNDCVKFDASGNTVDNGASCGGASATPGFINTPTVSAGAATLLAQCTSAGCTDFERVANASNSGTLTLTTPASGGMTTGEQLFVEVTDSGTAPSSIAYTAGSGVTLNYSVLGNAANATACGAPPATGNVFYRWVWNSTSGNLTLLGCGPQAGAATLSTNLGGTGADLHAAASGTYPKANGSGVYAASTLAAAGTGSCTNQAVTANNGDAAPTCTTLTSAYVNNSIALTGTDINTSNQVTATHIASATNTDLVAFNSTGNVVNYAGSGPLSSHNFATQISAAGALTGAQPAFTDISGTATVAQTPAFVVAMSVSNAMANFGGL